MSFSRRTFIKSSVTSGAALLLAGSTAQAMQKKMTLPANFSIKIMATNWGFDGTNEQFCAKAKAAGYDGIEIVWPAEEAKRTELFAALKSHQLEYAFLVGIWGVPDHALHLTSFQKALTDAAATKPLYINCHAGHDYYSFDQNKAFIDFTTKVNQQTRVPIYNETHRGRILYAAPIAKTFIEKIPELRLTLDISHWCNVHESLLGDQPESVELALKRTDHIHARVGHAEGPQVNDPRAPEWKQALDTHLAWWDKVLDNKIKSGSTLLTFLTEFGPVDYMPALPYSRQPVANQWEINVYMLKLLRERYAGK
jgi:sugar phosphate isomerase/epimerase